MTATWHWTRSGGWGGSAVRRHGTRGGLYGYDLTQTVARLLRIHDAPGVSSASGPGTVYTAHDGAVYAWAPPRSRVEPTVGGCPVLARDVAPAGISEAVAAMAQFAGLRLRDVLDADIKRRDRQILSELPAAYGIPAPSRKNRRQHARWAEAFKERIVARLGWDTRAQWRRRAAMR